jgi:hypothetical protein
MNQLICHNLLKLAQTHVPLLKDLLQLRVRSLNKRLTRQQRSVVVVEVGLAHAAVVVGKLLLRQA